MTKARIYIVEDEALIAMEIRDRLETLGYEVCGAAARGEDALAEISRNVPDLVLMDIMLAGELDGIRTAELVVAKFNVPVVYLTAYATEEVFRRAKISGPYGYILKPFEEAELRIAVELALHKHRIDRKLQESELRHRLFFELAGDSIYILAAEGEDEGKIVDANQAAADMHGYSREELLTMKISDLAVPEDAPKTPGLMGRILRGEIVKAEVSHRKKDGTKFPIDISAGLLEISGRKYVLAFDRDITERKQAEAALHRMNRELRQTLSEVSRSQKEWQETFDSITDLVSIHDADFRVIKANKAFREKCGLAADGIPDKKCYELFHGTCSPISGCPHRMTLNGKETANQEVFDSGSKRLFRVSTFPYHSPEGAFIGSVHIARDITDERDKELQLIMSERLASLGQMASGLAHEINNPLAGIAGCAEGLKIKVQNNHYDPAQFVEYLDIIEEEVMRCKGITTGMLSFVRKTSYEQKEVDLNKLLDKALEIIGFQGRLRAVKIEKRYAPALPVFQGNEGELRQVFIVLVSNALDAMEEDGAIIFETGANEDSVYAKISDTGPGIAAEHLTRIFDPFFTTKSDKGGSGLGLSIAHKIVTNHNGGIDVDSSEGNGATFTVTLPLIRPE